MRLPNATGRWNWWHLSMLIPVSDANRYPDLPWRRDVMSLDESPALFNRTTRETSIHEILARPDLAWHMEIFSSVASVDVIMGYTFLPWNRYGLSQNKEMTLALMDELDEVLTNAVGEWDWYELSMSVPMDEIRAHPDLPWDPVGLAFNPGVTVDDVIHMDVGDRIDSTVSMEEIKANPLWSWSKWLMSSNPSIIIEMVVANPDD